MDFRTHNSDMDTLIAALEKVATDRHHICGSLHYVKNKVTNTREGINEFRDHGGIVTLVKCLKQVNSKVLAMSLSILANCSMDATCRQQLLECGIMKDLSSILKILNVSVIVNNACRMIANLSESHAHILLMYKHNIPSTIVKILANTSCDKIRYSAIRALRKIWENSSRNGCTEMLKYQAPLVVSKLLTSKRKEIVVAVLRAIISFLSNAVNAKYPINNTFALNQILGNIPENVTTIKTLMNLLPEHPLICKIIYLMCLVKQSNTRLHQTKIITQIVNVLKKENNLCLVMALCKLLEDPSFRAELFDLEDGVSFFLNLLSGTDPIQKELATNTLLQFKYNPNSLKIMVSKGLIQILINNLASCVQQHKIYHLFRCEMKYHPPRVTSPSDYNGLLASSSGMSPHIPVIKNWSPTMDGNIVTDFYSPCYSPVCESFDNESIYGDESKSDISDYEDNCIVEIPLAENNASTMIQALLCLCYVDNIVQMMANKKVWDTILYYVQFMKGSINTNAINILEHISTAITNFDTILTDRFILLTHQRLCRPIHELNCQFCEERNQFGMTIIENSTKTFESCFAREKIFHMMSDENTMNMIIISLTIPHVIRNQPNLLLVMLSKYKMYVNLCNIIRDDRHVMYDDAIAAIMALFKTSNITYRKGEVYRCVNRNCHNKILKRETTVILELDDGTLINANKSFLSSKSPMFEAMFRCGGFKEAYQNTIRLYDVSSECFESFMQLLDMYCDCLLPRNVVVLMELIMIADKYMLHELSEKIITVMINSLSLNICLDIYKWVKEMGYQLKSGSNVGNYVIEYLFSSNAEFPNRVKTIKSITKSDYGEVFIEDFTAMLKLGVAGLTNNDNVSKFYLSEFSSE